MFQLTYTKTPGKKHKAYGQTWTHTVASPPQAFMDEYEKLSPAMAYNARYGFKQSTSDAYADVETYAEFVAELDKKVAANYAGTINERSYTVVVEKKTPLETEILRIAAERVDARIKETGIKVTVANRDQIIETYANNTYKELAEEAQKNLDATNKIAANPEIQATLAALFATVTPSKKPPKAA